MKDVSAVVKVPPQLPEAFLSQLHSEMGTTLIAVVMNGATGQTANEAISLLDYGFSNFQLLNLSEDDFHILSGGTVMVPSGATADDLTTEDTESDGQILRTYSFGGTQVGTAVVEDSSQESSSDVLENDENMDSAKAYSESRSQIPVFCHLRCGHPAPDPSAVAHDPDHPFLILVPRRIYFRIKKSLLCTGHIRIHRRDFFLPSHPSGCQP